MFVTLLITPPLSPLFFGTCIHIPFHLFLTRSPTKTLLAFLFLPIHATCQTHLTLIDMNKTKLNPVALVRERTIPTERPPPVGEVSANFCG